MTANYIKKTGKAKNNAKETLKKQLRWEIISNSWNKDVATKIFHLEKKLPHKIQLRNNAGNAWKNNCKNSSKINATKSKNICQNKAVIV